MNEKYGRWEIIASRKAGKGETSHTEYLSRCECGTEKWQTSIHNLKKGRSYECKKCSGARRSNWYTKHKLYPIWVAMRQRCKNPSNEYYHNYGARGIRVCDAWDNSAEEFITWSLANGWEEGLQLDRRDNDLGYNPDNCRFITQQKNLRNSRAMKANNTTGYRGVVKLNQKTGVKYKSSFTFMSVVHRLGHYDTAEEAAKARDEFIVRFRIPATLNFPRDDYKPADIEDEFERSGVDMVAVAKEISARKKPRSSDKYGVVKVKNSYAYTVPASLAGKKISLYFPTEDQAAESRNKMIDDHKLKLRRS